MSSSFNSHSLVASLVLSLPTSVSHFLYYCEVQLLLPLGWEGREQGGTTGSWRRELYSVTPSEEPWPSSRSTETPRWSHKKAGKGQGYSTLFFSLSLISRWGFLFSDPNWIQRARIPSPDARSVQSYPTLCNPMDCSMPGFPVHHQLLELAQTQVHWVSDAIQPSHPLLSPSPPALNLSQHQGLFKWVSSSHQVAKVLELQHQSFQWIFRTDFL